MKRLVTIAALLGAAAATAGVAAQTQEMTPDGERRVSRLIVYGNDPCPQSSEEEIVVCVRRPENDRFRIPENMRRPQRDAQGESWANSARQLEYVGRQGIQSCSPVGPGGFTGCWAEMMRQAREDAQVDPEGQPVP